MIELTMERIRAAFLEMNKEPEEPFLAVLVCSSCRKQFSLARGAAHCTHCGYNQCWQGDEFEKYSGPKFKKVDNV